MDRNTLKPDQTERRNWRVVAFWALFALAILWMWQVAIDGMTVENIPYSRFKQHLEQGEITEVLVGPEVIEGKIEPKPLEQGKAAPDPYTFRSVRVDDPKLVEQLEAADVEFIGERPSFLSQLVIAWLAPLFILLLIWAFIARRVRQAAGSALSFGKNKAKIVADPNTGVTFEDVAGCNEAKGELQEVVQFLREPARYQALGARIPKGVLLVGPPGTGKTLLARAVAGEAKVPFYSMSGSDFVEMFVGVGAARVRDLFEQASKQAPCIVFIDEIDAIGRQRGAHVGVANDERETTLNQLLVELDGFGPNQGVIILAATNRPDVLDRALLRPGRFDRQVVLDAPDVEGRKAVLKVHMRDKPLEDNVDVAGLAKVTPGLSGADLANLVNEAALLAARRGATKISNADLHEAVEKVVAGPERPSRRLNDADRRRVAYHETGHALVAYFCEHADPVHKISIVPRGHAALGYTMQLPDDDRFLVTQSELLDRMRALLGGRAAEELIFKEVSSGAQNDLEKATTIARQMVTMFGMGRKVGLPHIGRSERSPMLRNPFTDSTVDCSEVTAREVDEEVRDLLASAYRDAKSILVEYPEALERVATHLLEHETIDRGQFEQLLRLYPRAVRREVGLR